MSIDKTRIAKGILLVKTLLSNVDVKLVGVCIVCHAPFVYFYVDETFSYYHKTVVVKRLINI